MSPEHPHTLEDRVAERLAKLGTMAAIISLFVLLAVLFGNVLILAVRVAVSVVLATLVNVGPGVAALLGGTSNAIGYYGRTRLLRRKEKFSLRDEARDQALDQAGNALQNAPATLRSRLGCSSPLSLGVFAVSLILCGLTYLPPPLHVFGANIAAVTATPGPVASTPTSTAVVSTATTADTATAIPTPIAATTPPQPTLTHAPTATPTAVPVIVPTTTATATPGNLVVLPPTTVSLGNLGIYCLQSFTGASFSFKNNGGTPLYWTINMPTSFSLAQGYAATGSLQPSVDNIQNEVFQGTATAIPIVVKWGPSAANEPNTTSIPVSCKQIG